MKGGGVKNEWLCLAYVIGCLISEFAEQEEAWESGLGQVTGENSVHWSRLVSGPWSQVPRTCTVGNWVWSPGAEQRRLEETRGLGSEQGVLEVMDLKTKLIEKNAWVRRENGQRVFGRCQCSLEKAGPQRNWSKAGQRRH